jgi:hypothetical protein
VILAARSGARHDNHRDHAMVSHLSVTETRHITPRDQRSHSRAAAEVPVRVEISIRGRLGPTLLEAFPTLEPHVRGDETVLSGALTDQSALFGVLHQIEALGLELVEVRRLLD